MLNADDIAKIFEWIEMLLIGSLKRNLTRHEAEEKKYGFNWSAWQAEKLRNLDKFRRENAAIVGKYTDTIDRNTRALLEEQFREGVNGAAQEAGEAPEPQPVYMQEIVQPTLPEQPTPETTEQVSTGSPAAADEPIAVIKPEPQFFGVDTVKVNKLVEDMTTMEKQAETAALRLTDDVYRQTVNRVQLAMSTGSMTLNKAIDTADEDFLNAGINCIEYKDGRRVNIADYVRMALRTTSTRAALQGKSEKYKALGYDTVAVSSYGMCSPTCLPYQGRVYINDAFTSWSGETQVRTDGLTYGKSNYCGKWFPLLSSAIAGGLFHPNCRHSISLWRDGDPLPETLDNSGTERRYKLEQQQRELERAIRKVKRKVEGFTDPENIAMAKAQLKEKQKQLREFIDKTNADEGAEVLRRDSGREKIYDKVDMKPSESEKSNKKNQPTSVNTDYIMSEEYKKKFIGLTSSKESDELMCTKARDMLLHRNNTLYEDMYLIDEQSGRVVGVQTHSTKIQEITYNKSLEQAIKKHKQHTLISIHNHPESKPPSGSDFSSCGERKYQKGVICCHNGDVYVYQTGNKPFTSTLFDKTVDKYKGRGYNEYDAYIETLNQFQRDYGIRWEKR